MTIFFLLLPHFISFLLGYALLRDVVFRRSQPPEFLTSLFLSWGLGLGVSAYISFLSLIFLNGYNRFFILLGHMLLLLALAWPRLKDDRRVEDALKETHLRIPRNYRTLGCFVLLIVLMGPALFYARAYPYGGWDAWNVWNFKAKFIFEAPGTWQNIFLPMLWRSSPHYPLLLPLMNVWGWSILTQTSHIGPMIMALMFTFCSNGLAFSSLKKLTGSPLSILAPALVLTLPFYLMLAVNQYCDIVLGFYLFASLYCLVESFRGESRSYLFLAGLFVGLLSFTKPEGLVCAGIIVLLVVLTLALKKLRPPDLKPDKFHYLLFFLGLLAFSLPAILFHAFYAPHNATFINGLFSKTHPSNWLRLRYILLAMLAELLNIKWNGLLLLLLAGVLLGHKKARSKQVLIIPLFLFLYGLIVISYYFINTYFQIEWWINVTSGRITFSLLPTLLFWSFYSAWRERHP